MARSKSRITQKGQITIPQEYREKFNLSPGDEVLFYEENNRIYIISARQYIEELADDMRGVEQLEQERRDGFANS